MNNHRGGEVEMFQDFFVRQNKESQELYMELLAITGSLSRLFAESQNPYLYYRAAENIFCKAFEADNLSRGDVSADASKGKLGIGLKTFLHKNGMTFQKVAEFNKESHEFRDITDNLELIFKMSKMRNERIRMTKRSLKLENMIYHLVTRSKNKMLLFEEHMREIDLNSIKINKSLSRKNTIRFSDRYNEYSFSLSKNTLLKRFITPKNKSLKQFEVNIYEDPFDFLLQSKSKLLQQKESSLEPDYDYVILPLYSPSQGEVQQASGLNAWNAKPRPGQTSRDPNEVYINVPAWIHRKKPNFFKFCPGMSTKDLLPFQTILPNKKTVTMKLAQSGGKAISSNPLPVLGQWILRDVLNISPGTLVTRSMLNIIGIDSVKLTKISDQKFLLDFKATGSYEAFEESFS